ncbi:MAG TPA: hypothetical protein VFX89_09155 [Gammaproteobacteria bacterium]|nr:hypothetical protein [Gammaproteobacteria bacterium]
MSFVRAFGLVAICSITTSALAEESAPLPDFRHVLARADADVRVAEPAALDRYTGSYRSADGVVFYVVQEEDGSLTIDLPANCASESRLRADTASGYFVAESPTVVRFEADAAGRVTGLTAYPANGREAIAAVKEPMRRGVVTIDDVPPEQLHRGIVTIEDVPTDAASVAVAAN